MRRRSKDTSTEIVSALNYEDCPAKTWLTPQGYTRRGRTVFNHCQIVGETARQLIERFPEWMQSVLFPAGSELAAAAHDIGKVSPPLSE